MPVQFQQAKPELLHLRMALMGPPGSGKTWTALTIASYLAGGPEVYKAEDVALIDSERRSALKYARKEGRKRGPGSWDFGYVGLESFHPENYIEAIRAAEQAGFKVLVIDSLSHAWAGKDGALELVDRASKRSERSGNQFAAWREVTPLHNALVDAIMSARMHVLFTLRTKMGYEVEKDERGKTHVRKLGLQPVMREGVEYEADVVGDMDQDHNLVITKTRCPALSGWTSKRPGADVAKVLTEWLGQGSPQQDAPQQDAPPAPPSEKSGPPPAKKQTPKNGNGSPAPKNMPADGEELEARVKRRGEQLAREGLCQPGEYFDRVLLAGRQSGYGDEMPAWAPKEFPSVAHFCATLEADLKKAKAEEAKAG